MIEQCYGRPIMSDQATSADARALHSAARSGDRRAFEELCRQALPKLRGTVRKMIGHPQQTTDIVQEALSRAWTSVSGFDGRAAFSTWLCRIGSNLAIDFLRSEKRWRDRAQVAYANECAASADSAAKWAACSCRGLSLRRSRAHRVLLRVRGALPRA